MLKVLLGHEDRGLQTCTARYDICQQLVVVEEIFVVLTKYVSDGLVSRPVQTRHGSET